MYHKNQKKERANAYIKKLAPETLTIGKGVWKEKIPFSDIISIQVTRIPLKVGTRVRAIGASKIIGIVTSLDDRTITLITPKEKHHTLQIHDLQQIQGQARDGNHAALGSFLGLALGFTAGALHGASYLDEDARYWNFEGLEEALRSMCVGTISGIIIGTAMGTRFPKHEWRPALIPTHTQSRGRSRQHPFRVVFQFPLHKSR